MDIQPIPAAEKDRQSLSPALQALDLLAGYPGAELTWRLPSENSEVMDLDAGEDSPRQEGAKRLRVHLQLRQLGHCYGTFTSLKNCALCSGKAVLINMPVPSSKPAAVVSLGTIDRYQWKYLSEPSLGDKDRVT